MITFMFRELERDRNNDQVSAVLCITNRMLCKEKFLVRIRNIAKARPAGIVLREKDLTEEAYKEFAADVIKICNEYDVPCILHSFVNAAKELKCTSIHLPLPVLRTLSKEEKGMFTVLGASCHSVEEAREAQKAGCTYITAGHVFDTDCKKGLPGRGIAFLKEVCESVSLPVYAIGGIGAENLKEIRHAGAKGACVMSGAMVCEEPGKYLEKLAKHWNE